MDFKLKNSNFKIFRDEKCGKNEVLSWKWGFLCWKLMKTEKKWIWGKNNRKSSFPSFPKVFSASRVDFSRFPARNNLKICRKNSITTIFYLKKLLPLLATFSGDFGIILAQIFTQNMDKTFQNIHFTKITKKLTKNRQNRWYPRGQRDKIATWHAARPRPPTVPSVVARPNATICP